MIIVVSMHHPRHWPQGVPALLYNLPQSSSLPICHFPLCREWQEGPGASTTPFLNLLLISAQFLWIWDIPKQANLFHPSSCPLYPVQLNGMSLPQMTLVELSFKDVHLLYCSFPSVAWKDLPQSHFFPFF